MGALHCAQSHHRFHHITLWESIHFPVLAECSDKSPPLLHKPVGASLSGCLRDFCGKCSLLLWSVWPLRWRREKVSLADMFYCCMCLFWDKPILSWFVFILQLHFNCSDFKWSPTIHGTHNRQCSRAEWRKNEDFKVKQGSHMIYYKDPASISKKKIASTLFTLTTDCSYSILSTV